MGYIYLITNKINGKQYVGQTQCEDIWTRWKQHMKIDSCSLGRYIANAYKKYGIENFDFKIICVCFDENCDDYEDEYVKKFNTIVPNGYNLRGGGGNRGKHHPETLKLMSEKLKGRIWTPMTDEIRKKISEALKGEKNPNFGKPISQEQKQKISDTRKRLYGKGGEKKLDFQMNPNSIANLQIGRRMNSRMVGQYTLEGTLIATYNSINEAATAVNGHFGNVSAVCNPKRPSSKTYKGFIWKYIDGKTRFRQSRKNDVSE
jgi:group I intron endonuclease